MNAVIQSCAEHGMVKCPRCWHMSHSLNFDNLCNHCVAVILEDFPEHASVPHIKQNLKDRGLEPTENSQQTTL